MEIVNDDDVFEAYGRWNTLVAQSNDGRTLGSIPAHDGDFFPESVLDYVEALRKVQPYKHADLRTLIPPIRVDVDITQACNAHCTFCFSRPYQLQGYRDEMVTASHLEQLIADLGEQGTRTIRFCGGGDPLVHPEIKHLLPLPHKHGIRFCVITSGDLLDDELSELMYEHVDHFRWSVNASSDRTRLRLHRPRRGANLLSENFEYVRSVVERRRRLRPERRQPMIWATFLILPDNMKEIVPAARILKDIGVDSVSFRPAYHGLGGTWTAAELEELPVILAEVQKLADPPRYSIFTPKRHILESPDLKPADHFRQCISRRVRTLLEATAEGLALQSCGMYRGNGPTTGLVVTGESRFEDVWRRAMTNAPPADAPKDCSSCIDVSMNTTLNFIWNVLSEEPSAKFRLALIKPALCV